MWRLPLGGSLAVHGNGTALAPALHGGASFANGGRGDVLDLGGAGTGQHVSLGPMTIGGRATSVCTWVKFRTLAHNGNQIWFL